MGSRDLLLEFWSPLHISRLATGGPNEKMQNKLKRGRERVTWPSFSIFGPSAYLGNGWR